MGCADIDDPNFTGFDQIPGLASQRLMAEGIGFGAEGDWKTACLCRTLWVIQQGMPTGCSFLEDYTLNFAGDRSSCLQSHMLEICPLIAKEEKPKLEVHFLGIGIRKQQTARLVFTSKVGRGIKATVVDLGNRFRLIISITCYDRNGNVIKQVTSDDDGNVDNGEEPDPTPSNPTPNPDDEEGDGGLAG